LVKYVEHVGQRRSGRSTRIAGPPAGLRRLPFFELFFLDGRQVTLDAAQTEAFRRFVDAKGSTLDLDQVDEDALGHVLVRDSESGDVIVSPETLERDEGRHARATPPAAQSPRRSPPAASGPASSRSPRTGCDRPLSLREGFG
jgi:hypothetical protein